MDYKIISVESRKGGVGKTTAALNMAKWLIDHEYVVLFIDVDVTGTNVFDGLDSLYWKNCVNKLNFKNEEVNLLQLFEERFLSGQDLPEWTIRQDDSKNEDKLFIKTNKINVLGSSLFRNSRGKSELVCDASIFFDELQAFWFVEFLQNIIKTFYQAIESEKAIESERTVILLDNSPGFFGISPTIHEWLTDLGPNYGKFLTISSLDKQDLISCAYAIEEIHQKYCSKNEAVSVYNSIANNIDEKRKSKIKYNFTVEQNDNGKNSLSKESMDYFLRIATDTNNHYLNNYVKGEIINNGDIYAKNPRQYQAFIINKIPEEVKNKFYYYNFGKIWREHNSDTVQNILSDKLENHLIYFDDSISMQFIESSLKVAKELPWKENEDYHLKMRRRFKALRIPPQQIKDFIFEMRERSSRYFLRGYDIASIINKLNKNIEGLVSQLELSKFPSVSRIIEKEWYPSTPFKKLVETIYETSDYFVYEANDDWKNSDNYPKNNEVKDFEVLKQLEDRLPKSFNYWELLLRNSFLSVVLYIANNKIDKNYYELKVLEYFDLFETIYEIQRSRCKEPLNKSELSFFLANEVLKIEDIYYLEKDINGLNKINGLQRKRVDIVQGKSYFLDIYKLFCTAQARMLDLLDDYLFLIDIFEDFTFNQENKMRFIYSNIKNVANAVIINKSIVHSDAKQEILKSLSYAQYMSEFQRIIGIVAKDWGLV